jgi:hypothetical protein
MKTSSENQLVLLFDDDDASGAEPPFPLLPTPRASDRFGAGRHGEGGVDLRTAISLLDGVRHGRGGGGGD